jgi:acyl dehydratase
LNPVSAAARTADNYRSRHRLARRAAGRFLSAPHGCKTQPFTQRIAYGTLIFSIAIGMTAVEINPAAMSYDYDRLRSIKPVFMGDTITCKAPSLKSASTKISVVAQSCKKSKYLSTVLTCEHLLLAKKLQRRA